MENSLIIALSRQGALRRQMDVVANNLANMNSTGFKSERMMFIEHLVDNDGGDSRFSEDYSLVRDIATARVMEEGPISDTHNQLDLAIHGEGFFVVETDNGERYTRNGHFRLDETGQLVTQEGDPVLSDTGDPFFFAPTDTNIEISRDGTVTTNAGPVGRISVVTFESDQELRITAGGLYAADSQPTEAEERDIVQGALEGSNVEPILEMTRMIEVHRAYTSASKLVEKEDERIKKMISQLVGSGSG